MRRVVQLIRNGAGTVAAIRRPIATLLLNSLYVDIVVEGAA
jgi:hypothetical protein